MQTRHGGVHGDRGDVITSGLLKTVVVLLFVGLVLYEAGAVIVNRVQLDEAAQTAALAGARALGPSGSTRGPADVRAAEAARSAVDPSMAVEDVSTDGVAVTVRVARVARTLLLHRLGPFAGVAEGSATATADTPGA